MTWRSGRAAMAIAALLSLLPLAAPSGAAPLLLPCIEREGSNDQCPQWFASYDGPGADEDTPYASVLNADASRLYVTGFSDGGDTGFDAATMALDTATGTQLWTAAYDSAVGPDATDMAYDVVLGPSGALVYIGGSSCAVLTDGSTCDILLAAYDVATGAQAWARRLDGPGGGLDAAFAIAAGAGPDGADRLYVAARSFDLTTGVDVLTLGVDGRTGTVAWSQRFDGGARGFDGGSAVALAPDGSTVVVTGPSAGPGGDPTDVLILAYDAASGAPAWNARHATGVVQDWGNVIAAAGDAVFIGAQTAGSREPTWIPDYLVAAHDLATGVQRWTATYDGAGGSADTPMGMVASADRVFITGGSRNLSWDFATVAYDGRTGAQDWAAVYDGPLGDGDSAWSLAYDPARDELYVAGSAFMSDALGYQHAVVGYVGNSGAVSWTALHQGAGIRRGAGPVVVAAGGGRVFLSGQVADPAGVNLDYASFAYAADPARQR